MTTCIPHVEPWPGAPARPPRARRPRPLARAGFTLSEVLIASTLATLVLAGVLAAFLFLGRTGLAAGQYQAMENDLRQGLELFASDARRATALTWTSAWRLTFTVPASGGGSETVTYAFEAPNAHSLTGGFYRINAAGARELLVDDVSRDFAFKRYKLELPGGGDNTATNDLETKQLQISLRTLRSTAGGPALTQAAISARYVLRNKSVSR